MIWLDSAATSFQKPLEVRRAVFEAMKKLSSPGRGGYPSAMAAADVLFRCRCALAEMFEASGPENVIFTSSATHGLNIAISSLVGPGDKVVITGYEHNAVTRPLRAAGANICVAAAPLFDREAALSAFRRDLPGAAAAVCCHVSNVFGFIQPLGEIALACREAGVPLIVDASQSAGVLPLHMKELGCAFMAMPGHKGLLGPQGTGVLLCAGESVRPLMQGGTGSESESWDMPDFLPDRLEPGTHNVPGIAGLLAGVEWLHARQEGEILRHETQMRERIADGIRGSERLRLYEAREEGCQTGVLSITAEGTDCEALAESLALRGIAVRGGLHCAPLAHRTANTLETGTVRLSVSPFITACEADAAAAAIRTLA